MARHPPTSKKWSWSSHKKNIRSNEERVLNVPKFKHDTFGKRAFAAWASDMELLMLCDEIEAFKRNLKTHLFVKFVTESTLAIWFWRIIVKRPRMLSVQFVVIYKPCKSKPKPWPIPLFCWYPDSMLVSHVATSNGSWCMGIKGEMSGTVCVTFTWYMYIYELFITFVCFVVYSLL